MTELDMVTDRGMQYHVLPADDPLAALNILRQAAGLAPLSSVPDGDSIQRDT
jgi:hypothetical protein